MRDHADHAATQKRGSGRELRLADLARATDGTNSGMHYAGPVVTTAPDRLAIDRERAASMRLALDSLAPEEARLVQLRLFEDRKLEDVARELDIGIDAARYRFRRAASSYRTALRRSGVPGSEFGAREPN